MTRRVVITGLGTVNSLASDVKEFWRALCAGRSGIGLIELIDKVRTHNRLLIIPAYLARDEQESSARVG